MQRLSSRLSLLPCQCLDFNFTLLPRDHLPFLVMFMKWFYLHSFFFWQPFVNSQRIWPSIKAKSCGRFSSLTIRVSVSTSKLILFFCRCPSKSMITRCWIHLAHLQRYHFIRIVRVWSLIAVHVASKLARLAYIRPIISFVCWITKIRVRLVVGTQ